MVMEWGGERDADKEVDREDGSIMERGERGL